MKKLLAVLITLVSLSLWAQNVPVAPQPTNAPQYTVNLSFLGATPYGSSQGLDVAGTLAFTTNNTLRADYVTIPGSEYNGTLVGDMYNLCGVTPLENVLATTSFSCGKFSPYAVGGVGYGKINSAGGLAWKIGVGANYSLNNIAFNVGEVGYCEFGPSLAGQSHGGICGESGFSFLFGTNAAATQAKAARIKHANAKKLAKINAAIAKAYKSQ